MRASIIRHTADIFDPDMLIVDKEPLGPARRGAATLHLLQVARHAAGAGPARRDGRPVGRWKPEWERKNVAAGARQALRRVLGLWPAADLRSARRHRAAASVPRKMVYTGYLRAQRAGASARGSPRLPEDPFILVTPGGGGDGEDMVDWVLRAYETDPKPAPPRPDRARPLHEPRASERVPGARGGAAEGARR